MSLSYLSLTLIILVFVLTTTAIATTDMEYATNITVMVTTMEGFEDTYKIAVKRLNEDAKIPLHRIHRVEGKDTRGFKLLDYKPLIEPKAYNTLVNNMKTRERRKHWQLTDGAVGCYLGHVKAWTMALEDPEVVKDGYVMVVEDDVNFKGNFTSKLVTAMKKLPKDWTFFHLGARLTPWQREKVRKKRNGKNGKIFQIFDFWFTHCYIIKVDLMRYLLQNRRVVEMQVDAMLSDLSTKFPMYALSPRLANQNGRGGSLVQTMSKKRKEAK